MKYKLISLSGLIHDYQGEAKEYIPMPTVGFYDTTDAEDAHRLDVAMREHRKFESQCVLVEDQERAKRFMYGAAGLGSFENDFPNWKPKDRTLYTVEAPEMERVEQCQQSNQLNWSDFSAITGPAIDYKYRTVMRFKEVDDVVVKPKYTSTQKFKTVPEAKESQEEFTKAEVIEIVRKLREELIGHCKPWYNACRSIETDCNWVIENLTRKS